MPLGGIAPFSVILAQEGLAECNQLGKNQLNPGYGRELKLGHGEDKPHEIQSFSR